MGHSATARSGVLSSRYSTADAAQFHLTPLPPAARLAHGVPEGSKRSHPNTLTPTKDYKMHRGVGRWANERLPVGCLSPVRLSRNADAASDAESATQVRSGGEREEILRGEQKASPTTLREQSEVSDSGRCR